MLKAVLQKIFSRMVVTGLAILIQVLWLFFMLYEFSLQYTFANLLLDIAGLLLVIHIIDKPGNVSAKLAWTFVLLLFPIPGIVVYYVFGRPKLTKKTQLAMDHVNRRMERHLEQSRDIMERLREKDVRIYRQAEYIRAWSHFPIRKPIIIHAARICLRICFPPSDRQNGLFFWNILSLMRGGCMMRSYRHWRKK